MQRLPLHRSLAFKLFLGVSFMLCVALGINAWHNAESIRTTLLLGIQDKAMQNARRTATSADAVIDSWLSQLIVITNGLSGAPKDRYSELIQGFASSNPEFLTVELMLETKENGKTKFSSLAKANVVNANDERLLGKGNMEVATSVGNAARSWLEAKTPDDKSQGFAITNLTLTSKVPTVGLVLSFPVRGSSEKLWAVLTAWQTKLYGSLSGGGRDQVALLDAGGRLVSASNVKLLDRARQNYTSHPLLRGLSATASPYGFKQWHRRTGPVLGAYAKLPRLGLIALTESDATPAYAAMQMVLTRSLLWAALLLLVSLLASYLAASGITRNLRQLMATTVQIANGDFKARVELKSNDEIGLLGGAVNNMGGQLELLMGDRLEKARLEAELKTAKIVQDAFFPKLKPDEAEFRFSTFFRPASECGGDWWGHYRLSPKHELICIADATGHGVPAALVTAMVFAATSIMARRFVERGKDRYSPSDLLRELNATLCETESAKLTMTFFAIIFDLETGFMHFCNAAHNFPLLLRKGEVAPITLRSVNDPLGMYPDVAYKDAEPVQIMPGDRVILFTDGLIECTDAKDDPWGRRRFHKALKAHTGGSLVELKDNLVKSAYAHFGDHPAEDDVTVVVTEVPETWESPALPKLEEAG